MGNLEMARGQSSGLAAIHTPAIWRRRLEPSPLGRLGIFLATTVLVVVAPEWRVAGVLVAGGALAAMLAPGAFGRVLADRTWPVLGFLAVGVGACAGAKNASLGGIPYSQEGLAMGLQLTLRALTMLLAIQTLANGLSLTTLAGLLERLGLRGFGFAMGVAVNTLPMLQNNFRDTLTALRLRGGFRRRRWAALRLLLLTTIVNCLRQADDIVAAAEARGYRVDAAPRLPLVLRPGDALLLGAVALTAALVLGWTAA